MNKPELSARLARILIVDDESDNRELLKIMLEWEGFATLMATGGEEALTIARAEHPDLMLLDLMMPGLDGSEVTLLMQAAPETRHIPVIVLSAMSDRETRARVLAAGAEDFMTKPVDRSELCQRVRAVLLRRQ